MAGEKPSAAFVLSLIGGIFILLAGIVVAVIGAALTSFFFGIGGLFGILGVVWGAGIVYCAVRLNSSPEQHTTYGVLIILFSVFSWVGAFGGFVLGFLLALLGGILALVWSPPSTQAAPVQAQPTMAQPGTKYCASCGTVLASTAEFCTKCGAKQP